MERGFIKGGKAPFCYGRNLVNRFEYEDIIKCLRKRPWLVEPGSMPQSYFRTLVRQAWDSDPWYDVKEAQQFLGLHDEHANAVHRYIQRGWLEADRRPGAGGLGEYVIRKRAIDRFLQNDPRPALYHEHRSAAAVKRRALCLV